MAKTSERKIKRRDIFLFFVVFLFFSFGLGKTPVHLNQDEMMFALNANGIASAGVDYYGNRLPFYFWHLGSFWSTPVIVYLTSLFLKLVTFSESTIRLPSVFVGTISVILIFLITRGIFKKRLYAYLALFFSVTTPVLFIHSRLLLDNLYPIPFVLFWLFLMDRFVRSGKLSDLFLSGLSLGIGFHSYHAAKIMMPIYIFASTLFLVRRGVKKKFLKAHVFGFLLPIILFFPWLIKNPDTILNQVSYIGSIDKSIVVSKGIWGVFNFDRLLIFLQNYSSYFDPKILFLEGDRSLIHSTGKVGAFLFPMAFFLVFGFLRILIAKKPKWGRLLLFGFLTYPIAPAIVNEPQRISRGLIVIPFVILISVYGAKYLLESKKKIKRYLGYLLIIIMAIQFLNFANDYFGDYRKRSSFWFNNNIGGVLESVIENAKARDVKKIYLDSNIYFVENYFDFYKIKHGFVFDGEVEVFDPKKMPLFELEPGSIVALKKSSVLKDKSQFIGDFERIKIVEELDGSETFFVYYRDLKVK